MRRCCNKRLRGMWMCVCACAAVLVLSDSALAASSDGSRALDRVSIRVKSDIEAGGSLPDIEIDPDADGEVKVTVSSDDYEVEDAKWITSTSKTLQIGEEPSMKVVLTPTHENDRYFKSDYAVKDIKINGGTTVSSRLDGGDLIVTLRLDPLKGTFHEPDNVGWKETKLGIAVWEKGDPDSGVYEAILYRDDKQVHKESTIKNTSINFYPYMTKAVTYTFKVRAVPAVEGKKKAGKKSDWMESGELLIRARDVSDGTGKENLNTKVTGESINKKGWVKAGSDWYYYPVNNVMQQGGWANIDDRWYLFDVDGRMITGWKQLEGRWYYLDASGAMVTGWAKVGDDWYYLDPREDGPLGALLTGWNVIDGCTYYMDTNGAIFKGWRMFDGKWYYFNELEGSLQGALFKGWIFRDGKTFFSDEHGAMMTGWQEIEGQWHYFYPSDGSMAADTWINGYYVDEDGIYRG